MCILNLFFMNEHKKFLTRMVKKLTKLHTTFIHQKPVVKRQ